MNIKNCPHCNSTVSVQHSAKASLNLPGWIIGCCSTTYIRFNREAAITSWNKHVEDYRGL